jgi:DNA-binding transcriptional regulator YdaS (Cro superfamily)
MGKKEIYVEQRPAGDYAVRRPDSERASAIERTQRGAIERAREIAPSAAIHVERVRHTNRGRPDEWRNP